MSNLTIIPAYLGNAQHGEDFYIGIPPEDFLTILSMSVAGRVSSVGALQGTPFATFVPFVPAPIPINTGKIQLQPPTATGFGTKPTTPINTGSIHLTPSGALPPGPSVVPMPVKGAAPASALPAPRQPLRSRPPR